MRLIGIAAIGSNLAIGRGNDLLWKNKPDMQRFKRLTTGHPIIVGRKTFQSFGDRPLPNRTNIVVTRDESYHKDGILVAHSTDEALEIARQAPGNDECYVIGGGEIYRDLLDRMDLLRLTLVKDAPADADTFFPDDYLEFFPVVLAREAGEFEGLAFEFVDFGK